MSRQQAGRVPDESTTTFETELDLLIIRHLAPLGPVVIVRELEARIAAIKKGYPHVYT
jgi:hypothetical protein